MEINDQARKELLAQVEYLTDEVINRQPAEDRWSIKQILQHLYLMEGSVAKTIQIKLAAEDQNITIDKPIQLTVDRSNKIEAPDFVTPTLEYSTLHDLKSKLTATHSTLHDVAENATEDQLAVKSYPHPVFGEMSLTQWIPFVGYHEQRHIEQIKEVKQQLGI
ncbi:MULTISPECIES: DinB family protein [unclassified Sporosarcina]|uniref:DinB family protein n=1 Tax=unclassified Sporosarcina TaxID=2647733 RepID=UPI000C165328|nr:MULTISPECIES: DinB family protein [unclassified Sporosarcina]PID05583.1 hypothetical protein CSV66_09240 [Sporosarcina sp. P30]PID08777.1 hypothetical protein CSV65_09240 [Sporosarcina sp. P31]PID11949.1 hypothetical protein CSV64_09350 [Sporosarcina sp. P32b]